MMEEVGSHDGDEEQTCATADAGCADGVVSDALQDAARTNITESK